MEFTGNNYARNDWRKMLGTRKGTIIVAGICAALAAAILIVALNHYRESVGSGNDQETVLVASGLIQKGTAGDAVAGEQLFQTKSVAAKQVSTGAIADTAQLHGRVAVADIYPGQQLTAAEFTTSSGLTSQLAPAQRAMTVALDPSHGMIGQLQTGDHVDVYADLESSASHTGGDVRLLVANAQVLKAGTGASGLGGGNSQNQQSSVTLNVSAAEAGGLAYAADNGKIWLVLRPANASTSPVNTITAQTLLSGGIPVNSGGSR
ncbi:MAG TPA: Flp pilus assembly protein CpaB [Solirubrobacteraceae bacterium]|nr:Flp pilus assembly protein CpaB [Solirubrobacteraceae bacterium]